MNIVHLTASTFYGGPERQMLGLAAALPDDKVAFASFAEGGRCRSFLTRVRQQGFAAITLENDTPHLRAAAREITENLEKLGTDVLLCHGYKANLLGRIAARRRGIHAIAVARGWTGESLRVRVYEALDRLHLRCMDAVVAVSDAQADKVRRCGVRSEPFQRHPQRHRRRTLHRRPTQPTKASCAAFSERRQLASLPRLVG